MATLLQHVRPWMQHVIAEFEARVEERMEHMIDQKVHAVHKHLDAFELRVLKRLALTVDVTTLKKELKSLCADVIVLLTPLETELESASTASVDDVVMNSSYAIRKCPCSGRTSNDIEVERLRMRERLQTKVAWRASIVDEELRQQQAREIGVGPSSSVSTTEGAEKVDVSTTERAGIVDGSTTEGVPNVDPVGFGKPDPPAS
ncbi:hypothetical protein R3W88_022538 [Solanum pinnatisectum]|uniref:Integrase core domain containing protein n=1 Tax=Solanum pinnatisectum TaxID=50273 RepID=A0AAV9LUW1_9SOLN|nr:hypothetical protein R3W88_022538 [Solanum pinnatisectum]